MKSVRKRYTTTSNKESKCTSRVSRVFMRCVFCHKFVGIWIEDDQSQGHFHRLKGYVIAAFTFSICIFQIFSLTKATSVEVVLQNSMETMVSIAAIVKVSPVVIKRDNLLMLIRQTKKITTPSHAISESERKIVNLWLNYQDKIIKSLITSYTIALCFYILFPLFKKNGLPLEGHLPNICYINPWYSTTYIIESMLDLIRTLGVLSNDILCVTFLCQLCSELELVKHLIIDLGNSRKGKNLKETINRHATALDYGGIICDTFSGTLLCQHLNCSIFLCLSGLITLQTKDPFILFHIGILSLIAIITMLITCFVGEILISSSLEIATTIENSIYKGYSNDVGNLKLLYFMLMRAQKPICIMVCTQGQMNLRFFSESINKLVSFFIYLKSLME